MITPTQAGTALQDQTQGKYTNVAASKFPDIASNTLAGSPSGGGAMGFVVDQFSRITSNIANADPATINGPNDIVSRATSFFKGNSVLDSIINLLFHRDTSLASRVSAIEGKIATGAEFFDNFNRGDTSSALGGGWTQGGNGQPLGIHDQAAQITVGGVVATPGRQWAKAPTDASGDDFTVSMVTHPVQVSDTAPTSLIARANAAFTEGLSVNMFRGKCYLSRWTRSGNTWTYTDITNNLSRSYSGSATVEFKGSGTSLQVIIDSIVVMTATDSAHAIDASHRATGFSLVTTTAALGLAPSYSGGLASYSVKSVAALASVSETAGAVANVIVAPVATQAQAASTAAATAAADAATASGLATTATALGVAAQNQAASSAAVQNAGSALGISASVLFSGADGETLSTVDFTDDGSGNLAIRAPLGYIGIKVGAADGVYGTRLNTPTATDNQSATIVVGDSANRDQKTRLLLRCDTSLTRGAFLEFADNSTIRLGQWTRSGGSWDFSTVWSSAAVDVNTGQRVEFRAVGSTYIAFADGIPKLNYTDTGGALTVGAAFRWVGFAMQRQTINSNSGFPFFTPITTIYDSYRIASLAISDMKAPGAVVGIGWKFYRAAGTMGMSTLGTSSFAKVPANLYDNTTNLSQVTVTNQGQGVVTIQRSGYYSIVAAHSLFINGTDQSAGARWCAYVNGTLLATGAVALGVPTFVYLAEGDTIQPGMFIGRDGGSNLSANQIGGSCNFAGYLMQTAN
ncbi:hypothetical protein [Williamsia phyllosphaerae]|uniref:hypothetical protein n=1 Tax=Williamsia phyllosphaerae TaxID=885042 RepID=UPI00166A3951|nr:hypothetical protein [Williamsia phyllosphaerae]